jgi:hypothetical protein
MLRGHIESRNRSHVYDLVEPWTEAGIGPRMLLTTLDLIPAQTVGDYLGVSFRDVLSMDTVDEKGLR